MPVFKLFLKALTDKVPDDVLQNAGKQLKSYFDRILVRQTTPAFTGVTFKVGPNPGEVGEKDLLVYITDGSSFIVKELDRLESSTSPHQYPPGSAGGGTIKMPGASGVCSEVMWTGGLIHLKTSTQDKRAFALANLVFHEWAHNKYLSDADALSKNEANGDFVHLYCGGGVLQAGMSYGQAAAWDINPANIAAMVKVLGNSNKQYTAGLT